jgi:hypothetical protein
MLEGERVLGEGRMERTSNQKVVGWERPWPSKSLLLLTELARPNWAGLTGPMPLHLNCYSKSSSDLEIVVP